MQVHQQHLHWWHLRRSCWNYWRLLPGLPRNHQRPWQFWHNRSTRCRSLHVANRLGNHSGTRHQALAKPGRCCPRGSYSDQSTNACKVCATKDNNHPKKLIFRWPIGNILGGFHWLSRPSQWKGRPWIPSYFRCWSFRGSNCVGILKLNDQHSLIYIYMTKN